MPNATQFWGVASDCNTVGYNANDASRTPVVQAGTCNSNATGKGDGNGILESAATAGGTGEIFQFWKQLQYAGFIGGKPYSGRGFYGWQAWAVNTAGVPGTNVPASRLSKSGWAVFSKAGNDTNNYLADGAIVGADTYIFYGNSFMFGAESVNWLPGAPVMSAPEAWAIDTKLDDGMPGKGRVIVRSASVCTDGFTTNSDLTRPYKLSDDTISCALYFLNSI